MPSSEHTPLIHNRSAESAAERGLVGVARGAISPNRYKHQHQYRTTTKVNNVESDDVLQVKKIKQRKNVRSFRRKRQDFATWKGRIGVHCEYDEYNLKKLMNVVYQTLTSDWEIMDCYDVIRLWLPDDDNHVFSAEEEEQLPPGEDNSSQNSCPSMPEVFVFSFGAVVFWNFKNEETEKLWMEKHLYPNKEVVGLKHNAESIDSACDELGFCYGTAEFRWHRDVVELQTRDVGEKLAVSFAVGKSANLSILEWRMLSAIQRNAHIPEDLAKYGSLHLSRRQINVEVGRLYLLNNAINLETNLLDTPEEFWEDDRFEPEYEKSIKYLDVNTRIPLLDKRLSVLKDLNSILMEAAHNHHASVLEWIIIILIVAEVAIEGFRCWRESMGA